MALRVTREEVWAGEMPDRAGSLARALEALAGAGTSLDCVIARRRPENPGTGVVFVSPVKGKAAQEAARDAGLKPAPQIATLRVEGPDRPGLGSRLTRAIADAGVNVRGVSAMVIGNRFVAYVGLDSAEDLARATRAIKSVDAARPARRAAAGKSTRPARRARSTRAVRAAR
jgi:hypothetical protein